MIFPTRILHLLCLALMAPMLLADASSNAVNERLPVKKIEMEAHWKVDCAASWVALMELRGQTSHDQCVVTAELRRQITLCAFIYQPPGEVPSHSDPNYAAAIDGEGGIAACDANAGTKK